MKIFNFILSLVIIVSISANAQMQQDNNSNGRIQDRLLVYINQRLQLNENEQLKFNQIYLEYFHAFIETERTTKNQPMLNRQQEILNLRLNYRDKFAKIIGTERANNVFAIEREFRAIIKNELQKRMRERQNQMQ